MRRPKTKPKELRACCGKVPLEKADICYFWGEGVPAGDYRLLHNMFSGYGLKDCLPTSTNDPGGYLREPEKRGYDLKTLRFSIKKHEQTNV